MKAKKYDHPHVKIGDFAEITQGGLPLFCILCRDMYYVSDSGSRGPEGILEGQAGIRNGGARQGPPSRAHSRQAKRPSSLSWASCPAADLEIPRTHSNAPGSNTAIALGGRGEEGESLRAC